VTAKKCFLIWAVCCLTLFGFKPPAMAQYQLGEASPWPAKLSVLPGELKPLVQTYTGSFSVNTDAREQVRDFYNAIYSTSENVPMNSSADVANCFPGTNSLVFQQAVLRRINWFRAMAGEPANVTFNSIYNSNAQAVAVMISSSGLLNHDPPTNWPCYSAAGAAGAGGNQAGGANGADAITLYIWDFGSGNSDVGHRRWMLFPSEQIMGTGDMPATNSYIAANSTYVFDSSINDPRPATRQPYVAWPPEGFVPYQVTYPYWSFALSNADLSAATVNMTSNGVPVAVVIQPYQSGDENNQSGAGEDTLVWVPMGLDANCECTSFPFSGTDTIYSVTISNILVGSSNVSFAYNVTLFDPAVAGTDYVATTVSGPAQAIVNAANNYNCTPLANTNTTGYQWLTAQLAAGGFFENAAADQASDTLMNFTPLSNPDYPLITNSAIDSSACLHFVHTVNDTTPQIIQCDEILLPATNTVISFASQIGYAFTNEVARVQVSTNGGVSWSDIFSEAGCNDPNTSNYSFCENAFTPYSLSLSNYAGQPVLLRFNYDFLPPYSYFVGTENHRRDQHSAGRQSGNQLDRFDQLRFHSDAGW
jgi:Cysteine-rich secretory protein family